MSDYRAIAEFYDAEYEQSEMLQRDITFFLSKLPKKKRLTILDVACGTGRSCIPLAQAGHRVVGFDYARDMLAIATRKRDSVGLTRRELDLRYADARKLDFKERFDWACVFFNTFLNFTTLEMQDAVLQQLHAHLKPRGRVWIDIFNPDLARLHGPPRSGLEAHQFYVPALERSIFSTCDIVSIPTEQRQKVTFHYRWFENDGTRELHKKVQFELTWIMPREMKMLLERNGFELEAVYGDHDGSAIHENSPRIIVQAKRI